MVGPARIRFVMVPSLFFRWREELIDVHLGHRSWYHERSMAVLRLEPTEASCFLSALQLLYESIDVGAIQRLLRV